MLKWTLRRKPKRHYASGSFKILGKRKLGWSLYTGDWHFISRHKTLREAQNEALTKEAVEPTQAR